MFHPWRLLPAVLLLRGIPAAAQVRAWADVDATRVESDAVDNSWGLTLSPALLIEPAPGASLLVGATYGRYADNLWALQGTLDATLTPGRVGPLDGELSLSTAALTEGSSQPANVLSLARGRLHWAGTRAGLWGGAGGGAGDDGIEARGIAFADIGGWTTLGPATLSGSLLPTTVAPGGGYLDAEVALHAAWRRFELSAGAGHRWWRAGDFNDESWASVGLQLRVVRALALTATAGRFPADPVRGFGDGRYIQFGARVGMGRGVDPEGWALRQAYRTRPPLAPPVVRDFEVRTTLAARRFVVRAPGASRVELAGDFTDWEALPLMPGPDGTWWVERVVPSGTHRINLRVDGGPWGVPPGVPTVRDDFGGVVGLLVLD